LRRIGLISDTHGLLRPQALEALQGSEHIVHAGDIGGPEILAALERIAPVTAVRGNNDVGPWARAVPERDTVDIAGVRIHVVHDIAEVDPDLQGVHAVVTGHSHKPKAEMRNGVLFVNPGSAGPRRFTLPISLGYLLVEHATVKAELVELKA
jgi:putative phosphoesterase